jgi:hypothetical protein
MISYSVSDSRRVRATVSVLVLAVMGIACDRQVSQGLFAEGQSTPRNTGQVLEFDLPLEHWNKGPDGQFVITGFRVGTFRTGESVPLFATDVPRDAVVVDGKVGRISLTNNQVPGGDVSNLVLRMQTLSRAGASDWSDPSPAPSTTRARPVRTPGAAAGRSERARVSMVDVERHPRLADALRKSLGPSVKPDDFLIPFRNLDDLALALVISRDQAIELSKLRATLVGPPRRSVRAALRELKPSLRGSDALQKARAEAKQLLQK